MNIDISEDTSNLFKIARPNDKNINVGISNKEGEDFYYQSSHINQANSFKAYENVKKEILSALKCIQKLDKRTRIDNRREKFIAMGRVSE